jgi:phosphate transport system substrate-binding protein
MINWLLLVCLIAMSVPVKALELKGAGASFPAIVYTAWANKYSVNRETKVKYEATGSGDGIQRISAGTIDFGASDMPLKSEDLKSKNLIQFPMLLGAIIPVINLPGIHTAQLKLDGDTLAKIFMGEINQWNDPLLRKDNPALALPNLPITIVYRGDSSGTTYNFSHYLSKVNAGWRDKMGVGLTLSWLSGVSVKNGEGMVEKVRQTVGAIGYVDYANAVKFNLVYPLLKNKSGQFASPNTNSVNQAAIQASKQANLNDINGFSQAMTDQAGATTWPITAATFILVNKKSFSDDEISRQLIKYFDWSFKHGSLIALSYDFGMIPDEVVTEVRKLWLVN